QRTTLLLSENSVTRGAHAQTDTTGTDDRTEAARAITDDPSDIAAARIPTGANAHGPGTNALGSVLFDMPSAAALAAAGSEPSTPAFAPDTLRYAADLDSRVARLQDALGGVSWAILHARTMARGRTAARPH